MLSSIAGMEKVKIKFLEQVLKSLPLRNTIQLFYIDNVPLRLWKKNLINNEKREEKV